MHVIHLAQGLAYKKYSIKIKKQSHVLDPKAKGLRQQAWIIRNWNLRLNTPRGVGWCWGQSRGLMASDM